MKIIKDIAKGIVSVAKWSGYGALVVFGLLTVLVVRYLVTFDVPQPREARDMSEWDACIQGGGTLEACAQNDWYGEERTSSPSSGGGSTYHTPSGGGVVESCNGDCGGSTLVDDRETIYVPNPFPEAEVGEVFHDPDPYVEYHLDGYAE